MIAAWSYVKAAFIARRQRKQLRNLHYMAKKIQVIMRVYLQWLREEERKACFGNMSVGLKRPVHVHGTLVASFEAVCFS